MLQLILGPGGTGKTTLLYEKIKARADAGQKSILLVPEQFTGSTEGRILRVLGEKRAGLVESLSFTTLAERVLSACGGSARHTLTDAGRMVLLRRTMDSLQGELRYFGRHRRSPVFCRLAAETVSEFKSAGITSEALTALAPLCGTGSARLAELALIYGAYETNLHNSTGLDPADRLTLAADALAAAAAKGELPDFLQNRAIFIDEFDTFNAPKKQLMETLLLSVPEVTVALCADRERETASAAREYDLFSGGRAVARTLTALALHCGAGAAAPVHLDLDRRHSAAPGLAALSLCLENEEPPEDDKTPLPGITLYAAPDRQSEAREAAAAIRTLAAQGVRYRKMAVVCRDVSVYRSALRYEFRLAGIPLFCDEPTTPEFSAPACAVRALLDLLQGRPFAENMAALAKTGLCALTPRADGKEPAYDEAYAAENERRVNALDNYIYTWMPVRADWAKPFERSAAGFEGDDHVRDEDKQAVRLAEEARPLLLAPVEKFLRECRGGATAQEYGKQLYYCLKALGAEPLQQLQVERARTREGIPAAQETAREWNTVMQLLNQLSLLLGGEMLKPAEYAELFETLLREQDLNHIPQTMDSVIITSAGKMRLDEPDYVFVLGLAEGEFPASPGESGLLTHADRDALQSNAVEMPDRFENRLVREKICFYKALTAAAKGLWLSWPKGENPELSLTLQPFPLTPWQPDAQGHIHAPAAALDYYGLLLGSGDPANAQYAADLREALALHAEAEADGMLRGALRAADRAAAQTDERVMSLAPLERLLGKNMNISASKLDVFYNCRYHYFLQYVLGLRARPQAKIKPNISGTLIHWVLEQVLNPEPKAEYRAHIPAPVEQMTDEQLRETAEWFTAEYVRQFMPDGTARFAYLLTRISRSVADTLIFIRAEQQQGKFRPAACEQGIGSSEEEGDIPSDVYELSDGHTVRLVGSIDRVDEWTDDTGRRWVRVVDYKTGSKHFSLDEVCIGLDCQMLMYLFTLQRDASGRFTGAEPAGVLYLRADLNPKHVARNADAAPLCEVDGLVLDEPEILCAMDAAGEKAYLPFKHDNGAAKGNSHLADAWAFERISNHLDGLITGMGESLYGGDIAALPLRWNGNDSCRYCDFRAVCCHVEGERERCPDPPDIFSDGDETMNGGEEEENDG